MISRYLVQSETYGSWSRQSKSNENLSVLFALELFTIQFITRLVVTDSVRFELLGYLLSIHDKIAWLQVMDFENS